MNIRSASLPAFALTLAAAFALPAAQAQTQPRTINRDELRACMNANDDLASRRTALEARAKANSAENAQIKDKGLALTAEKDRLAKGEKPPERLEREVKEYNARVVAARGAADALRADYVALNQSLVAHNEKCGGTSFDPEDEAAILKEREAGKK